MNLRHFLTTLLAAPLALLAGRKPLKPTTDKLMALDGTWATPPTVLCERFTQTVLTYPKYFPAAHVKKLREVLDSGNYVYYDHTTGPPRTLAELEKAGQNLMRTAKIRHEGWP